MSAVSEFIAVPGREKWAILVPKRVVGTIIGASGASMQATEREAGCRLTIENQPSVCLPPPAGAEWRAVFVSGAHGSCFAGLWAVLRRLRPSTEVAVQFPLLPEHWHAVEGVCADIEALTTCEVCLSKDRGSHHDGEESLFRCVAIRGKSMRVLTALKIIGNDVMRAFDWTVSELEVHKIYLGQVIGSKGAHIRSITAESQCVVEVPSADNVLRSGGTEGTVLVAVAGACEAHVEKAEKMISAILSKKQAVRWDRVESRARSGGASRAAVGAGAGMGSGAGAGLTSGEAEANVVGVEPEVLDGMVKALCAGLESGRSGGYDLIMFMMDESCRDLRPEHLDQMQAAALQFVASGHGGADVAAWLGEVLNSLNTARSRFSTRPYCEVLFFPSRDGVNPHKRLVQLLERARKSLDICVFTITEDRIANAVIDARRRGLAVRVITDFEQTQAQGSDAQRIANSGIEVRCDKSEWHMHHKFVVLDGEKLLTGSFNWTRQASQKNQENVLVTKDKGLVGKYLSQFNTLWEGFARNTLRRHK